MKLIYVVQRSLFLLILVGALAGCKKEYFEEGGLVKEAEENIPGTWLMSSALKDGVATSTVYENVQVGKVSSDWIFTENGSVSTNDGTQGLAGTWGIVSDGKGLQINIVSPNSAKSVYTYDIIKLSRDVTGQMVLGHDLNGSTYRYTLNTQ
ncbi:MAG: hypothetical protein IIA45_03415 [Bacteroidetes bacterium]|nr:hypothetical protein [Bacteroidota bacterium]